MGEVFRARDDDVGRDVALKVFSPLLTTRPEALDRFLREAKTAASVDHPGIVPVLDSGVSDGRPWIAMRLVHGRSLQDVIQDSDREESNLPCDVAAAIAREIARALHAVHVEGVVHRDIKPANVLLEGRPSQPDGTRVFLADFGLASLGDATTLTATGEILGTPAFMAPEQARGGIANVATDVYSLGATLYAMLTGRPPVEADSYLSTIRLAADAIPPSPRKINRAIDPDVDLICRKAMRWDASQRYASAEECASDLDRYLTRRPIRARRPSLVYRSRLWLRRHPMSTLVTLTAVVVLAGAVVGERALRRSHLLGHADIRLASGDADQAVLLAEAAPPLPWPLRDRRRAMLLARSHDESGRLAEGFRAIRSLASEDRVAASSNLVSALRRRIRAARLLVKDGEWAGAALLLVEGVIAAHGLPELDRESDHHLRTSIGAAAVGLLLAVGEREEALVVARRISALGSAAEAAATVERALRRVYGRGAARTVEASTIPDLWAETKAFVARRRERAPSVLPASIVPARPPLSREQRDRLRVWAVSAAEDAFVPPSSAEDAGAEPREPSRRTLALCGLRLLASMSGLPDEQRVEAKSWIDLVENVLPAGPAGDLDAWPVAAGDLGGDGVDEVISVQDGRLVVHTCSGGNLSSFEIMPVSSPEGGRVIAVSLLDVSPRRPGEELVIVRDRPSASSDTPIDRWLRVEAFDPTSGRLEPITPDHGPWENVRLGSSSWVACGELDGRPDEALRELVVARFGYESRIPTQSGAWWIPDPHDPSRDQGWLPGAAGPPDISAVAIADLDGDGRDEIVAATGNGGGQDLRVWRAGEAGRAPAGPLRFGPFGTLEAVLPVELDGGSTLGLLLTRSAYVQDPSLLAARPDAAGSPGTAVLAVDLPPERDLVGHGRYRLLWTDYRIEEFDPVRDREIAALADSIEDTSRGPWVALSSHGHVEGSDYAFVDVLATRRGNEKTGARRWIRHRTFRTHEPGRRVRAMGVRWSGASGDGPRTGLVVWSGNDSELASVVRGHARLYRIHPPGESTPFPLDVQFARALGAVGRYDEGARRLGAKRSRTTGEKARGPGGPSRPRGETVDRVRCRLALLARDLDWEAAEDLMGEADATDNATTPEGTRRSAATAWRSRWRPLVVRGASLWRRPPLGLDPDPPEFRLPIDSPEARPAPEVVAEHATPVHLTGDELLCLTFDLDVEHVGFACPVFAGLVTRDESGRIAWRTGVQVTRSGSAGAPLSTAWIFWNGRVLELNPARSVIRDGGRFRVRLERTAEGRVQFRVRERLERRPGRANESERAVLHLAAPPIDARSLLQPGLPSEARARHESGEFWLGVYGIRSDVADGAERTVARIRDLELRVGS